MQMNSICCSLSRMNGYEVERIERGLERLFTARYMMYE